MSATKEERKNQWERVDWSAGGYTDRLKAHGGWLVKIIEYNGEATFSVALTFIPDPQHEWSL